MAREFCHYFTQCGDAVDASLNRSSAVASDIESHSRRHPEQSVEDMIEVRSC